MHILRHMDVWEGSVVQVALIVAVFITLPHYPLSLAQR